jgi:hypothetical protein
MTSSVDAGLLNPGRFNRYDLDEFTTLYWGIGAHIGEGIFQNSQGDLVGHVTDHGKKFEGGDNQPRSYLAGFSSLLPLRWDSDLRAA